METNRPAKKDNQGRNLAAVKAHFDALRVARIKGEAASSAAFAAAVAKVPMADWTAVDGVLVLRSGASRFVAVPRNGKKSAAKFEIIDLDAKELVTVLTKHEVGGWLWRAAQADAEAAR